MQKYNLELINKIIEYMTKNSKITEVELAKLSNCCERTIRRYIFYLKSINKVKLKREGKNREWVVYRK